LKNTGTPIPFRDYISDWTVLKVCGELVGAHPPYGGHCAHKGRDESRPYKPVAPDVAQPTGGWAEVLQRTDSRSKDAIGCFCVHFLVYSSQETA
jgi:hypothetical protein